MRQIKFKYYMQHEDTGYITSKIFELEELESYDGFQEPHRYFTLKRCQFTGLFDKQGVEIYEGDIIKDSSNRLMTVEWDRRVGTSRFIFRVINTIGHIKVGRFVNTHEWIMPDDNDIEVVGNIYENKELLNTDG